MLYKIKHIYVFVILSWLSSIGTGCTPDSPLTLGHKGFPGKYENMVLYINDGSRCYEVPTSCPDKRYSAPCGLGSMKVTNSVVLMFPDVNQYLVGPQQRQPQEHETGFLCQWSSSSCAALKGMVRYTFTGTLCRCYNMGVGIYHEIKKKAQ